MQIGTQIPEKENFEELCCILSRINIRDIELGPDILPSFSPRKVGKLSEFLRDERMKVYSVHAPFGNKFDLSLPEEMKRKKAILANQKVIDKMNIVGGKILVIHPGERLEGKDIENRLYLTRKSIAELLSCAEDNGIVLALENMPPGFVGNKAENLKELIQEFNSPFLKVCLDTGHSHIGGTLNADFDTLREHIVTFHIHDNDGRRDLHLQPPYGSIAWEDFIRRINRLSFFNPLIMESFPWGNTDFAWVHKEINLLFQGKLLEASCPDKGISAGHIRCPVCKHFFFEEEGNVVCYCSSGRLEDKV